MPMQMGQDPEVDSSDSQQSKEDSSVIVYHDNSDETSNNFLKYTTTRMTQSHSLTGRSDSDNTCRFGGSPQVILVSTGSTRPGHLCGNPGYDEGFPIDNRRPNCSIIYLHRFGTTDHHHHGFHYDYRL